MEFSETEIKGAYIVTLKKITDNRGYFGRAWCQEEFAKKGLNPNMVQLNTAFSEKKGTLRGMHFQKAPHGEAKFIRCTRGAIYDVLVDIREDSPTRGKWIGLELTAENGRMLYAGKGLAHGYQTLVDASEMYYFTSAAYAPSAAAGVRFDDSRFSIRWPLDITCISDADRAWPDFPA